MIIDWQMLRFTVLNTSDFCMQMMSNFSIFNRICISDTNVSKFRTLLPFLPHANVNISPQGHKISHDVSTGIIQMIVENFTRASEGTYTVQIHDGKAKTQSSLVLVGDGEEADIPHRPPITLEKLLHPDIWVCFFYFSFQSCSEGGRVPEKGAHQEARCKLKAETQSASCRWQLVTFHPNQGIRNRYSQRFCYTQSVFHSLKILFFSSSSLFPGPHFAEYLYFTVTEDCTVMLACKVFCLRFTATFSLCSLNAPNPHPPKKH